MTGIKSKIFVSVIVLAITAFIVYGTFNFFGHDAPVSDITSDSEKNELKDDDILEDGVYEGTAAGYGGDVTTQITIKNRKIIKAEVIEHNETPEYFEHASEILDNIVSANTYDVDVIAGCTVTSNAIKDGVHKALLKARGKSTDAVQDTNKADEIRKEEHPLIQVAAVNVPTELKDGVYDGYGMGYNGTIKVSVTIKDGKIADIEVVSHNEDAAYYNKAYAVIRQMLAGNSSVDTVSGATITSRGLINAVNDALSKAGGKKSITLENVKKTETVVKQPAAVTVPNKLKDGVHYGYGMGYNGQIKVAVTISDGKIMKIDVVSHKEDTAYYVKAYAVISKILSGASSIDTVSGATITSRGLIDAVNDALSRAGATNDISVEKPEPKPDTGNVPDENQEPDFDTTRKLKDGVYYAEANGYAVLVGKDKDQNTFPADKRIPIKVKLTVLNSKIANIEVVSHNETPEYFNAAEQVITDFLSGKERIDTVTGATITSDALKTAIKDCLRQAGQEDESSTEYSDGTWFGQAYGFYSFDKWYVTESDDAWKTQTNVSVRIEGGQIREIKLVHFGDDVSFYDKLVTNDAFHKINTEIIQTNGIESAINKFVVNKTAGTGADTDAISGATFSGNAYINAIKDALTRSVKYTNDKVEQTVKYMRILPHGDNGHNMSLPYGTPFDVGNFRIKVGYTKSGSEVMTEEIMTLREALKLGIEFDKTEFPGINENLIFIPMPKDPKDYTIKNNYDLKLFDPASGTKALYKGIEGAREYDTISIKEIFVTGPDGKEVKVPWVNPEEHKQVSEMPFKATDVKAVRVIDQNGDEARMNINEKGYDDIQKNGFGVRPNQPNILKIEILNPDNAKDSPIAYYYDFKSLQLEFTVKYNEKDVRTIKIVSEPSKSDYVEGDTLDLSGLKVQFADSNHMTGEVIPFEEFEKHGIVVRDARNGETLNSAGERKITLEKTINDRIIQGSFTIHVDGGLSPEDRVETTIRFYDLRSGKPVLIAEAGIPETGFAKMGIPEEYFRQGKGLADQSRYNWVIADQNGKEFKPKAEMPFAFTNNTMMVYREGADGAKMVKLFAEERVEKTIRFYDISSGKPVLVAEADIPEQGYANMPLPENYFEQGKGLADRTKYNWVIADQNGREFEPKAEMPFGFTKGIMMVYREGADGPKMVQLSKAVRTDTKVKFYDIQSGQRQLVAEAQIPQEGSAAMEIPAEYFALGKELANAKKFSWIIEDQNGKEFEPNKEQAYAFTGNKMMIYREGMEGFVLVKLTARAPEVRTDTKVKFYDIQSGQRQLVAEAQIPQEGAAAMEIPEKYFTLGRELANAAKFCWIIEDQNGKEFEPNKEQAYAFTGNKMMIYREGMEGFILVKLTAAAETVPETPKEPEVPVERTASKVKFYNIQNGSRELIAEAQIPEDGSAASMKIPEEYLVLGAELADPEKFSWIIEDNNGGEFTPNSEQAYAFTQNKMLIYREGYDGFTLVKLS